MDNDHLHSLLAENTGKMILIRLRLTNATVKGIIDKITGTPDDIEWVVNVSHPSQKDNPQSNRIVEHVPASSISHVSFWQNVPDR